MLLHFCSLLWLRFINKERTYWEISTKYSTSTKYRIANIEIANIEDNSKYRKVQNIAQVAIYDKHSTSRDFCCSFCKKILLINIQKIISLITNFGVSPCPFLTYLQKRILRHLLINKRVNYDYILYNLFFKVQGCHSRQFCLPVFPNSNFRCRFLPYLKE